MEQTTIPAELLKTTNAARVKLHNALCQLERGQQGFEDALYFYNAKLKEYQIRGRKVSAFTYAHSAFKISELSALTFTDNREVFSMDAAVKVAVASICDHFAEKFRADERAGDQLSKDVIKRFGHRLSIFGLIHCLELLEMAEEPFSDFKMYGFSLPDINKGIAKYVAYCKHQYDKFMLERDSAEDDKTPLAAAFGGLAQNLDKAPAHVREKWEELKQKNAEREKAIKHQEKYPDMEENLKWMREQGILTPADEMTAEDFQ